MKTVEDFSREATCALDAKEYEEALAILDLAVRAFPEHAKIQHLRAGTLALLGRQEVALEAYRRAVEFYGDDHGIEWRRALVQVGNLLGEADQPNEALACYELVLAEVPDQDALFNAGSTCQASGSLERARSYYLRVLELNPADPDARYNFAATYVAEGRFAEALDIFEALASADPDDAHLSEAVEHCLDELGRREEAAIHRLYRMKLAVPDIGPDGTSRME